MLKDAIKNKIIKTEYFLRKKTAILESISWESTKQCNLQCKHCYMNSCLQFPEDDLKTAEVLSLFTKIRKDFPNIKSISITGGEPFIRTDLFEILTSLKNLGFQFSLATNGTLISKELALKIIALQPTALSLSLDGLEKQHNFIRNNQTAYQKTLEGLNNLLQAGYPAKKIAIKTLVQNDNIENLPELYNFLISKNITYWHLLYPISAGRAQAKTELFLSQENIQKLKTFLKDNSNKAIKLILNENENFAEEEDNSFRGCLAGINKCAILANGDVISCINSHRDKEHIQGNIKQTDFKLIWENGFSKNRSKDYYQCGIH